MILKFDTKKSLDETCQALEKAVVANGFNVMAVHDLKKSMQKHGVGFDRECRIYEICNPHKAKDVLYRDMKISTALPCRISVYDQGRGEVSLASVRPTAMLAQFKVPELEPVAKEVEEILERIMQEAAR